ncbi:MAG: RNA polymerase sigma-70 factor [Chitinophagaceae bacterium]
MYLTSQDILFFQNRVAYTRDEKAYQKIFFHFHRSLFRFAHHLMKSAELAEEIVSDVMMRVWDLGHKLAAVENLKLYLFTAIKNACLNQLAKKKWEKVEWSDTLENSLIDADENPERQLLFLEIEDKVETAIIGLPPQCQMVFRLIKEEGFSHKEVAAIAEISQNTIETHMRLALKKIRLALNDYLQSGK